MKVIHVINDLFAYGGTPKKLKYLVKYSDKTKFQHVFICINRADVLVDFGDLPVEIRHADGSLYKALQLIKSEIVKTPTVICVHFFKAFITGVIASILYRLPLINNEHGSAYYRTGYKKYLMRIFRFVPKVTICNSNYVLGTINDQFKFSRSKLEVVYNPVERRKINDVNLHLKKNNHSLYLGHVGGFIPQRDQVILVDALSALRKKNIDAYLVLIGDGPERDNLIQRSCDLNVSKYVNLIGYTENIGDWLNEFDIYINPTLDEGFGIAVVEAMLAKVPVIAAAAGAHNEIIEDNINGLLYEPNNLTSLVDKIENLYGDSSACDTIIKNAVSIAENNYSPKVYSQKYHDIIDNMKAD